MIAKLYISMAGGNREGTAKIQELCRFLYHADSLLVPGGKAKPLKAPKKEKKELDEDDLAHKEKLKAGMECSIWI